MKTSNNKSIAILASWRLTKDKDDVYIPTTHHIYLTYVASIYSKVYLLSPMTVGTVGEKKGALLDFANVEIIPLPYNGSDMGVLSK